MVKIQGKEIKNIAEKTVTIDRTYRGEIRRAGTGRVVAYPLSFLTVGVSLVITDLKERIKEIQQIILSDDNISLQCDHDGVEFLGLFSVTGQSVTELRNKGETQSTLSIDLVSYGSPITKPDGSYFVISFSDNTNKERASFAQIKNESSFENYTLNGMDIPNNKLLVLGDCTLVRK